MRPRSGNVLFGDCKLYSETETPNIDHNETQREHTSIERPKACEGMSCNGVSPSPSGMEANLRVVAAIAAGSGLQSRHFAPTAYFLPQELGEMASQGILAPGEGDPGPGVGWEPTSNAKGSAGSP